MSSSSPEQSYPPVPETDQSKRDRDDAAASDDNTETQKPQARKRRRVVISCTECHRRKQKVSSRLCPCLVLPRPAPTGDRGKERV